MAMTDVFVVCTVDPTVTEGEERWANAEACFARLRVKCIETAPSPDGRGTLCRFSAPDAESVRIALRQAGVDINSFWLTD
jgi:hypothetical protein